MGCCNNSNINQIPINQNSVLFNEVPPANPKKYAYYVDGETRF